MRIITWLRYLLWGGMRCPCCHQIVYVRSADEALLGAPSLITRCASCGRLVWPSRRAWPWRAS